MIPHLDDELVNTVGHHRIQPGGGFVVNDDFRFVNNRPRQTDAFAHAAGKLRRFFLLSASQIDQFKRFGHGVFNFGLRHGLFAVEQESDIFLDGQRVEQRRALEQHSELTTHFDQLPFIQGDNTFAVDFDVAGVRLNKADDVAEEDAFATAASADDHSRLATGDGQINSAKDFLCPETFSQLVDFDQSE